MAKRKKKSAKKKVSTAKRIKAIVKRKPVVVKKVSSRKRTGDVKDKRKDAKRKALPPGWRISKSGKLYYEARRNRSDVGRI